MAKDPSSRVRLNSLRKRVKISYVSEKSEIWDRNRLRKLVSRPLSNIKLDQVEIRRKALGQRSGFALHSSYGEQEDEVDSFVTPMSISLPAMYGHIVYSLVADIKPHVSLEAGSGLGISGMYIGIAMSANHASTFYTFEIAEYWKIAQESISRVMKEGQVLNASFSRFPLFLNPAINIDFAFLDAKHTFNEIVRDYKTLCGWMSPSSVILIDDIGHSEETRRAWKVLSRDTNFHFSALINGRLGFLAR